MYVMAAKQIKAEVLQTINTFTDGSEKQTTKQNGTSYKNRC